MYFLRSGIPFVRFLLFFACGILTGNSIDSALVYVILTVTWSCFLLLMGLSAKMRPYQENLRSFMSYTFLFLSGITLVRAHTDILYEHHITQYGKNIKYYTARIISDPVPSGKSSKALMEVEAVYTDRWYASHGLVMGYLKSEGQTMSKNDLMLIKGYPVEPPAPGNPGQFDYREYLKRNQVYSVHFITADKMIGTGSRPDFFIYEWAGSLRHYCDDVLRSGIEDDEEYYIASALILGIRPAMSDGLYEAYSATGTVHALAVSGLHVSLVYLILAYATGFLKRIRYGALIFILVNIAVLWFYALVTGFSPSVVRAVTMFSFILAGKYLRKNTGIYNTLALSAFFILCFDPFWLLDIGFQFSFAAVAGIAFFYPVIFGMIEFKKSLYEKIWSLICISLAAQLAVSPLSIYYFHTFPLLFLPLNLVIVPLSSLALYTGIGGLLLCKIPFAGFWLLKITGFIIGVMNYLVRLPGPIGYLRMDYIFLDVVQTVLMYALILFFFLSLKYKNYTLYRSSFFLLTILSVYSLIQQIQEDQRLGFTVYDTKEGLVVSFVDQGKAMVLSDTLLNTNHPTFRFNVYNHMAIRRISEVKFSEYSSSDYCHRLTYGDLIVYRDLKILRLKKKVSPEVISKFPVDLDYIVFTDRFVLNDTLKFPSRTILLDARGRKINDRISLKCHRIKDKGAYVF